MGERKSWTYINDFMSPMKRDCSDMTFLSEFSIATEHDERDGQIEQMIVLKCGAIIVTDIVNAVAKAFTMDGKYLDSTNHLGRVFGITATGDNSFLVPGIGERNISFFELRDKKVHLLRTIKTYPRYFGIAMLPNKNLVAGTKEKVNILNQDCKTIRLMTSEITCHNPYHIRVTKSGKVVIADSNKLCITVFDPEGYVEYRVHLGYPKLRGISVSEKLVFFVNQTQNYVSMINLEKRLMTLIYPNTCTISKPSDVCVLEDGRIIISEHENVKIFKMKEWKKLMQDSWLLRSPTFEMIKHYKPLLGDLIVRLLLVLISSMFG